MDKEKEIKDLREKLRSIDNNIRGVLVKIETLKTNINKGYRHHDKGKYDAERKEVQGMLEKLTKEQENIRRRLSGLGAST